MAKFNFYPNEAPHKAYLFDPKGIPLHCKRYTSSTKKVYLFVAKGILIL